MTTEITANYQDTLPAVLTGQPTDYRNRTPHPPLLAKWCYTCGSGPQYPTLPAGCQQQDRVVGWSWCPLGIIHGNDGHTYAWQGDKLSLYNVKAVYLLAESMHV